jgi:L-alanine-DL-glutamate epimerase-like enolase superfamily enzyme
MGASTSIASVETWIVTLPRETPYLGPLAEGECVDARGYVVRKGNRTIYPTVDRSVLVRVSAADGTVGWGETYGLVAPEAVTAIIDDVLGTQLLGRDARDAEAIYEDLYGLMRVRGGSGGLWGDAMAALDIALWDLHGRALGLPVASLLGGPVRTRIPAYASGLPGATLDERVAFARALASRGFDAVKFAAVVSHEGIVEEMRALRETLGTAARIAIDLHWKFEPEEAIALIERLAPLRPLFVEAPCAPEDVGAQARVAAASTVPVALGEEWHNVHEARPRFEQRAMAIVQPEVAHTGLSTMRQIARLAEHHHVRVMPHATVGLGFFQAASLHLAASLADEPMHEYQHSVLDRNLAFVRTTMRCSEGAFTLPEGPGLGVEPGEGLWAYARRMGVSA